VFAIGGSYTMYDETSGKEDEVFNDLYIFDTGTHRASAVGERLIGTTRQSADSHATQTRRAGRTRRPLASSLARIALTRPPWSITRSTSLAVAMAPTTTTTSTCSIPVRRESDTDICSRH